MTYLEVPGASLYYETVGKGPLLVCISGANGSCDAWKGLASYLQQYFTVVSYDRRGFSRSYLSGSQDYEHRMQTDADDVQRLIKQLSNEPAIVLGNSSGALVALELLSRHPDVVRVVIPHEPPAYKLVHDCEYWASNQREIYNVYRRSGVAPAIEVFAETMNMKSENEKAVLSMAFDARSGPFVSSNVMYWFERELLVYPMHDFDLQILKSHKDQLLLVNGHESSTTVPAYAANVTLAEKLGLKLWHFAGAHFGFASHSKEFSQELMEALKDKEKSYTKLS